MKSLSLIIKIVALGLIMAGCSYDKASQFYLLRHAEKAIDGSKDPLLTTKGQERAERVAQLLKDKPIEKIYSTNYKRTLLTAEPLAKATKKIVEQYDPRELKEFADKLKNQTGVFLIVGHSNTTPQLTRLLSNAEVADMDESEFSNLYLVTLDGDKVKLELLSTD